MGGVYSHMMAPFEDKDLSFAKLKEILRLASAGKLEGSEKIDGWNSFFSFKDGKAIAARNKNDIKSGGLDAKGLINREFAGGDQVKKVYLMALQSFEKAINSLPPKLQYSMFEDGTIFYNAELIGPSSKNVINYDNNVIVIHPVGHVKFDQKTNEIIPIDKEQTSTTLNKVVDKFEQATSDTPFVVRKNAIIKLKGLSDKKDYQIAKSRLDKVASSVGLSDSNTIEDYLKVHIMKLVKKQLPEISRGIQNNIVENILGNEKLSLPLGTPKELRGRISLLKKEGEKILKNAIFPLSDIITDFAIEMLKGLQSAYVINHGKEIERLKKDTEEAIKVIQNSGNEDAMNILVTQLKKLKSQENITSTAEGFVFDYGGKTYKLTGAFAPINQLLGLFKYGRGKKIPSMQKENIFSEEIIKPNVIAIIPGGFKPPHAGHYNMAKQALNMPEVDKVFIFISPKERVGHSANNKITITADMSLQLWKLYIKQDSNIEASISNNPSPVKTAYEFMEKLNTGDTLVLLLGDKEAEVGDQRFSRAQEWADKNDLGIKVKIISISPQAGGVSGSQLRQIIANENKEQFLQLIPQHLSEEEKEEAWNIVNNQLKEETKNTGQDSKNNSGLSHEPFQNRLRKDHPKEKKRVIGLGGQSASVAGSPYKGKPSMKRSKSAPPIGESKEKMREISSSGGGSIEGTNLVNKKEEPYMIDRKKFVEELKLREKIQEILVLQESRKKEQVLEEEFKLRKHIRNILKEVDTAVHASTGINVLEELLKKIIPILETDYKTLTTDSAQRQSFRSHIINAVQNTITSSDIKPLSNDQEGMVDSLKEKSQKILQSVNEEDEINEKEDISVDIGKKEDPTSSAEFIDISKNKKKGVDLFTIAGEDMTGRNMALQSYEKIEKNIINTYSLLSDEEDKELFSDYLLTNLKLYFDKFEDELQSSIDEPTSNVYEKEKEKEIDSNKEGETNALDNDNEEINGEDEFKPI